MRKPHLRGRGPHFPILDTVEQYPLEPGYVVFTMPSPKRLRIKVGDLFIADTIEGLMMHESDHLPVYYFPIKDVHQEFLMPSATTTESPFKGTATHYSVNTGVTLVEDAGWRYLEPVKGCPPIADHVAFYCLPSARHVQVVVDGEIVADSRRATFLFETGMPTRYYLPISDTRLELLSPSRYISRCPYKGIASYYHVTVRGNRHENMVWYYPEPVHEAKRVQGLVCFYDEFVDRILIDGVEQLRPVTASSHGYY
jgi:uncharacterized protein (DUF427 family)